MRVLIVGPDTWVRAHVQRMLVRECGHIVTVVNTPEAGIRALHAVEWDALVTDVRIHEDVTRSFRQSAPRWEMAATVRMIQGRPEEFTRTKLGDPLPLVLAFVQNGKGPETISA